MNDRRIDARKIRIELPGWVEGLPTEGSQFEPPVRMTDDGRRLLFQASDEWWSRDSVPEFNK